MGQGRQRTVALLAGADETVQVEVPKEPDAGGAGAGGAGAGGAGAGGAGAGGAGGTGQGGGSPVPGPEPAPLWPAVVLGVGGSVFLVGGALGFVGFALSKSSAEDQATGENCTVGSARCDSAASAIDRGNTLGALGFVGLGLGAVSLAGMGIYLAVGANGSQDVATSLRVHVGPQGVVLQGEF